MKKFALFLLIVMFTAVITACGGDPTPPPPPPTTAPAEVPLEVPQIEEPPTAVPTELPTAVPAEEVTWFIGPEMVECTGVAPQTCLLVKDSPDGEYTFFYDTIVGFDYEEGYEYEIIVRIEPVENPPADASAFSYTLVEVVSKTAVATEETWFIGSSLVECTGAAPQTCLLVKSNPEDEYSFFYSNIAGFEYEEGYEYEIIVRIEPVENPPADASAFSYTLVEVVSQTPAAVSGTVSYMLRIALPDEAVLSVQLQDISLADAPAVILGEDVYATAGAQVPLPFFIPYTLADIEDNHDYSLSARITDGQGNLLFINDTVVPVITRGNPTMDVEVMVVQVGGSSETMSSNSVLPEEILGQPWQWVGFINPATGSEEIANPENYRVQFEADGTVFIQADCNSGSGIYSVDGSEESGSISIIPGPMTRVFCGEESLDTQFMRYLEAAAIWFTQDAELYFDLKFDSGTMRFAGEAETNEGEDITADAPESESSDTIPPDAIQIDVQGLADSYTWEARGSISPAPGPGGVGMPAHIIVTFDGETADEAIAEGGRYLYIFPIAGYENANSQAAVQISRLQELIEGADGRTAPPDSPMPLLPPPSSYMNRWAQFADLNFTDGSGVRYVSESPNRQAIGPWTNLGTAYYYQGLTADGRFYISLHWPVSTAALPNTSADVPADVEALSIDPETYEAYLQATIDGLNELDPADWQPDLAKLDALASSITFNE